MRTKVVTLYEYDELPSDKAKEAARDWFRQCDDFSNIVDYEDFLSIAAMMGLDIGRKRESNGREYPAIYWTGFWSQGDGASFTGKYRAKPDCFEAVKAYAPQDSDLHDIADDFEGIAKSYPQATATIGRPYGTRYSHECTMYVTEFSPSGGDWEADEALPQETFAAVEALLQEACRKLAKWFYRYLQDWYEDHNSDEQVAENIRINDYTFTEDGERED